jgi:serine/threonine protein kinase
MVVSADHKGTGTAIVIDDPNRWQRVKEVFDTALAHAPNERSRFLGDVCGADSALRNEVESLLAAHAEAGGFANRPAIEALVSSDLLTAEVVTPALNPGFQIGSYRIAERLDAGGMGEVYRARDTRLGRYVAVKVLPATLSGDPDRIARLQREARVLAALNHPHIATIHGLEEAQGVHALVMELIEGPTLAELLSNGPLPLIRTLDIARQIADALEAAHEKGIIHHDLKPANIKLTSTGAVKVVDFGLAKATVVGSLNTRDAPKHGVTKRHQGVIAGTPAYMSPEQACGETVDKLSDVWAFGCVLYESLTGLSAFGRATVAETFYAILEREPDRAKLPQGVPAGIQRVLHRCLEKDRRRRLHDIADARIGIEDAQRESKEPLQTPAVVASPKRAPVGRSRSTLWIVAALSCLRRESQPGSDSSYIHPLMTLSPMPNSHV